MKTKQFHIRVTEKEFKSVVKEAARVFRTVSNYFMNLHEQNKLNNICPVCQDKGVYVAINGVMPCSRGCNPEGKTK